MRINKLTAIFLILALSVIYSCGTGTKANNNATTGNELKIVNVALNPTLVG